MPSNEKLGHALLAGTVGGFAGALAMHLFQHHVWQPRGGTEEDEINDNVAREISRRVFRRELSQRKRKKAASLVHYAAGAGIGAAYALAVQFAPVLASGLGVPFGVALWLAGDEMAAPAWGFAARGSCERMTNELAAHVVYAATLETVGQSIHPRTAIGKRSTKPRAKAPASKAP